MADLARQTSKRAANALTFAAAEAEGDAFVNTGKELLLVSHTNGAGSPVELTLATQLTVDGEDVDDKTVTIGAGEMHLLGPFPTRFYNDGDGKVQLTCDSETDIELAVIAGQ